MSVLNCNLAFLNGNYVKQFNIIPNLNIFRLRGHKVDLPEGRGRFIVMERKKSTFNRRVSDRRGFRTEPPDINTISKRPYTHSIREII